MATASSSHPTGIPLTHLESSCVVAKGGSVNTVSFEAPNASSSSAQTGHTEQAEHTHTELEAVDGLPKADGGRQAWLFLVGCFFFEMLVWGFPFSFGVFEAKYMTTKPFSSSPSGIPIIGTCATGVMYLFAPVSLHFLETYPNMRRLSSVVGLALSVSALIGSSFANKVWQLILTQGVLYAIGGSLLYAPTNLYLDEWFIMKKGFAIGVMWSGVGFSGVTFPFLLSWLLASYGIATTLQIWSLILLICSSPLIYFVRPRLPARANREPVNYAFLQKRTFWFLQVANTLESLGFFMPSIYLPSYTRSLSLTISHSASLPGQVLLALLNGSSTLSAPLFGFLCDHFSVYTVILLSTLGSTTSVFTLWLLSPLPTSPAASLALLILFSIIYGVAAGGWSAIWSGMISEVQRTSRDAKMGSLMGLLSAGRGIGAVCSGPISAALLKGDTSTDAGIRRGGFANVVIFTGVTAFCGLVALGGRRKIRVENDDEEVGIRDH